jgi:hypothetical protein
MMMSLSVGAATMLVVLLMSPSRTGHPAVLVEVLSMGSAPIEATKLANFQNLLTCDEHLSELEDANPLIESRVALIEHRVHYDQALQCFPSKMLWKYWRHEHCLDGGECL